MKEQEINIVINVTVVGSESTEVTVDKVRIGEIVIPNVSVNQEG
jgi:hypothetical protein